jgi:hypothetical protein
MKDLDAFERALGRKLAPEEKEVLRLSAQRMERLMNNERIEASLRKFRTIDPAKVSPRWGTA